ncbi:MAG: GAF domain-containing protein [Flavobacteriales bacterium]|jgi:L-methionine (R)-S-oxide reductase|nr:GAF domain-containing protein [bacterium]MDB9931689.1 GAF domain-containing protein [Flavobacteriales bacterium]MDG1174217.1 GAF domain-containing protein [Flavobacteriales bacterium]
MAEDLNLSKTLSKEGKYEELIPQLKALITGEEDVIANLANVSAGLKEAFGFLWVGFYLVKNNELVLGPFQGPVACTRIRKGKGVCGVSWDKAETVIVPDVEKFNGHITCSSLSKSEIVIPILKNKEVIAVLDVDSSELNTFDEIDNKYLSSLLNEIIF